MKHSFLLFITVFLISSCSTHSEKTEAKKTAPEEKPAIPKEIDYMELDSAVRGQVQTLDSLYGRTPYYAVIGDKKLFIVMKGKFSKDSSYRIETFFTGRYKYGIFNEQLKPVLASDYDKIYNPNLTILNCMELKQAGKIGLYNFVSNEILEPQFDYIIPSSKKPDQTAYGFKNGSWYKIDNRSTFKIAVTDFSPVDVFKSLAFNLKELKENFLYNSYAVNVSEGISYGGGVVFTPSYIEKLNLIPEVCEDWMIAGSKESDFGTIELHLTTDTTQSITDKIISFVVSFYKEGVDGRGFRSEANKVIVYNKENKVFHATELNKNYDEYSNFCKPQGYKFVNDSTIEILQREISDTAKKPRYDFENTYTYILITKNGELKELHSNRYFEFTKYAEIDEQYFKGCYASWISNGDKQYSGDGEGNVWASEHLTTDDLDLMVNEIYAEYGFKFKTEKWQTYFSKFSWYKPEFDNVDAKVSALDKKNIETISKEKAKMKGKENDFVKKHKELYSAAG